jgi:hypothetical protein
MNSKDRNIQTIAIIGTLVVAAVSLLTYMHNKKHGKIQSEISALDKNIKELQLEKLKKENGKS